MYICIYIQCVGLSRRGACKHQRLCGSHWLPGLTSYDIDIDVYRSRSIDRYVDRYVCMYVCMYIYIYGRAWWLACL